MLKKKWILFLFNLLVSFIFFLIFADEYNLFHYINILFYFGFIYALIFLIQYTMKGGFFDGITFGFRRFHHNLFNRDDYLEEWREKPLPSEKVQPSVYQVIIFQSVGLLFLLIILLFFYYFIL
jgi:Domain of unknown function (DUF3899)